jgi:ankyrin repeat protein
MKTQSFYLVLVPLVIAGVGRSASEDAAKRFYEAIRANDLNAVRALSQSAGVNVRDRRRATPLMYASAIGSIEAMALLLDAGADLNAKNDFDATALIWSAGDLAKSRLLVGRGADVNARSKQGRTPIMMAAKRDGNSQLLRLMLDRGAIADAKDGRGNTALMHAAQTGDVDMIGALTAQGADVNAANLLGATPLGNAVCSNRVDAVKFLLAQGANANAAMTSFGAVRHGPIALGNLTPLMAAAPYGSAELVWELLNAGAKVNATDVRGMTPLMLAVGSETQDLRVVNLLLRAGAEPNVASVSGETALDWATKYGDGPVIAALKRAGAHTGPRQATPRETARRGALEPKEALNRSLALLQRSSTEYFKESGCAGCHHQIYTAMALQAARSSGLSIDETAAREQLAVMKGELASQQEQFLQGIDLFGSQVLIPSLFGLAEAGYAPDPITDSAVADLVTLQGADGSWTRGLAVSRAPIQESNIARTAQAVRTLRLYGPPALQVEIDERIARARTWLLQARPRTGDEYAMRLAGLSWSGTAPNRMGRTAQAMVAQQRADGGWGGNRNLASDALSTGEALYALHESGSAAMYSSAYKRGIQFLLRTQHDDGAWLVRSRAVKMMPYFESGFPFGDDQWISAAGTAWASLALASAIDDHKIQANSRYPGAP